MTLAGGSGRGISFALRLPHWRVTPAFLHTTAISGSPDCHKWQRLVPEMAKP
jgi:hypothetical protein